MLEAAIWIGIALSGLAVLGIIEYARSNSVIRAHGEAIKAALPIAALFLLGFITAAVAVLFFFLYFLSDFWQYALIVGGAVFAFLFLRIRRNWSQFTLAPQPERAQAAATGLFPQLGTLALQAAGAAAVMVMMVPVMTGGFLLYMFLSHIAGSVIGYLLLIFVAVLAAGYLLTRRRAPPP